ncbi:multidrug ABC transporter permease, partial [Saccharopolyspora sp. NPDC002686]
ACGLALPAADLPGPLGALAGFLPSGALSEALDAVLVDGSLPGVQPVVVLLAWGAVCGAAAVRTTRLT